MKFFNKLKPDLNLKQREGIIGYIFILPFIIGFIGFVLAPIIQSIMFSINEIEITGSGFTLNSIGLDNFEYALMENADFIPELITTFSVMLNNVFWILVFSFFAANLLNQKFRGRLLARVIFFLPVIVSAGVVAQMEQSSYMVGMMQESVQEGAGSFLSGGVMMDFLMQLRLPPVFMELIMEAVDRIPEIINDSGIQILIFLAGLQSIPSALYEAAKVEGATKWENFWLITLPLLSPLILTNIIYTIVDFFVAPGNTIVELIRSTSFEGRGFGAASAMSWIYFSIILVILAIIIKLASKFVFYHEE
ncbi:MAG: carbohydrate ABC transporter permease [bacterium]